MPSPPQLQPLCDQPGNHPTYFLLVAPSPALPPPLCATTCTSQHNAHDGLGSQMVIWWWMGVTPKIAPSMLSSDFANLASEAQRMLHFGADWLHMDIMVLLQYSFLINAAFSSINFPNINYMGYLDCHLMVTNPLDYVEPLAKAGASGFTFHVETSKDNWEELIQRIKSHGMTPGVALKPGTPIEEVYPLVEAGNPVEMVLVMTVEPGFGGQKFMPEMMDKVRILRKKYPSLDIEVDGGLGPSTIDVAASAGANCIVAGSSVFGAPEPVQVISLLRNSVEKAQQTLIQ
ncbi:hypothetical protein JHK82_053037 [Glycine max]|nr:hypothetical protein JHK86_052882 [Glycine max]KAG4927254.1 hypothetical protein JHK85_053740 [Glycine max]KAG5082874.1 hypothetical protein JHK84_052912 [Glycine max]KAG5085640.1 hypothetical protein JHK82_053037 [Glycine max]